jgi:hypothetical protein
MIKIHIKHLAIVAILIGLYFLYQRIEFVEVTEKRKLLEIAYSSDRSGTCYINYVWQTESGLTYTSKYYLKDLNPNLKKGKTYIHTETTIQFK